MGYSSSAFNCRRASTLAQNPFLALKTLIISSSNHPHDHQEAEEQKPPSDKMRGNCNSILRSYHLLRRNNLLRPIPSSFSSSGGSLLRETPGASGPEKLFPSPPFSSNNYSSINTPSLPSITFSLQLQRHFSSSPSPSSSTSSSGSGSSNIINIKSEEEFNSSLKSVQDKSLPAVFYFTAVWCAPCKFLGYICFAAAFANTGIGKFISPVIEQLTQKYPDVTTFKIDIDQEGLSNTLSQLYIAAVPTLHFFLNGKKTAEIVGADVARLKDTMEELYGKD